MLSPIRLLATVAVCFALSLALFSAAFAAESPILSNYRVERNANIAAVSERFEIHRKTDRGYEVYVPASRARELFALAPKAALLQFDSRKENLADFESSRSWRGGYHSFAEVQTILKDYAQNYPALASLVQYGTSMQGRPCLALRVGGSGKRRPEILLTAATHGDELITVEVLLGILDKVLTEYTSDSRIQGIVDNHAIYFVPVVNPDGFSAQDRYDNGRDPNRSYPWPENPQNQPTASVRALITFFHAHPFVASIDFHAFGELIMYPWAYTYSIPAAASQFETMGALMASHNGYEVGQISKIIYIAKGSSADYYHWKTGAISYGIEMARSKVPHSGDIASITSDNLDSTLNFIEQF